MPTALFLNGFENRVLTVGGVTANALWSSITGPTNITVSSDATVFRGAGLRSLKLVQTGGAAAQWSAASDAFATQTELAYRFYFRKSGNPSTTVRLTDTALGGSVFYSVDLNSSGQLLLNVTGGTGPVDGSVTAALSDNTWYLVDVVIDGSTTAYVGRLWLDGTVAGTDATTTAVGAAAMTSSRVGIINSVTISTGRDWYFDDWIIGTAADIDDKFGETDGIVGLVPDADGTHSPAPPTAGMFMDASAVDISGGNPAWDNLDSGDLTQTAEWVRHVTAGGTSYLEVAFGTTTLGAATPVMVQAEAGLNNDGTLAFTASTRAVANGNETVIFTGDWSIASGTSCFQQVKVPDADVDTQGKIDGLLMRFGYCSNQPAIPRWQALMYEVDIGLSAAATPSLVYQPALQPHRTGR